jgi:DNA-binding response OmpR family regulator
LKAGRPVIALIEDEPAVRTAVARALDVASYDVLSAATGAEGLAMLEDPSVDVALVDIVLPGHLDGITLVREAKRRNPGLRAILMSGKPLPEAVDLAELGEFLHKPSRLSDLLAAIARQLGRT